MIDHCSTNILSNEEIIFNVKDLISFSELHIVLQYHRGGDDQ